MAATVGLVLYGFGVLGVAYGWLAGEGVALFLFGAASIKGLPKRSSSTDLRPVLAFALPSLLFQTIDVTIQNTDRIILLSLTDLGSLGVYDVILGILFMMSFISLTLSVSLYPVLTRFRLRITQDKHLEKEIGSVLSALARYILILLLPISIMVSIYPYKVLDVLFGGSYASYPNAAVSFSILILSYSVWGLTYALHTSLRSMSEAKFFVISGICVIIFEIVGCWYLTSLLGLLGSALIRALYIILLFLSAWARLKQRGISWLGSIVPSILRITLAALLAGLLIFWLAPQDAASITLVFVISGLVYILLLFAFREINELDFLLASAVMPKFLHGVITRIHQIYNKWERVDVPEQQESALNHT
jgi:O-antigen/teichoic acid export membrane protein